MKIQLCLVGNYLEKHIKFDEFKNLINYYKNIFKSYELNIHIFIWDNIGNETKENIKKLANLYIFELPNLKNILKNIKPLYNNNTTLLNYINKRDGSVPGGCTYNIYCMFKLRKYAMDIIFNKSPNSYTFLIRVDMLIKITNINNWITNNTYHVNNLRCWRRNPQCFKHDLFNKPHLPMSDQISIGETKLIHNFYNMTDNEISNLFEISTNGENAILNRIKQLSIKCNKHNEPDANNMYIISVNNAYKLE